MNLMIIRQPEEDPMTFTSPKTYWLLFTGLFLTAAVPAVASNFGSTGTVGTSGTTNGVWLTDGYYVVVVKRDLTSTYDTGVNSTILYDYTFASDLEANLFADSQCLSGTDDVCVYDFDYGDNGLNGWNACDSSGGTQGSDPNKVCNTQWVRINEYYSPPATRIACHEIGHALGLRHTSDSASCLKRTSDGGTSELITQHDANHLNATY
jgi:hypothetical protein